MLIGFSVGNYRSFDEQQTISFVASKVMRHQDHIYESGNRRILKSGLIFGANAGGKSNFIRAISMSRDVILKGVQQVELDKQYFRIKDGSANKPGIFEYRLMVDEHEYSYGVVISYTKREIISEWLYRIGKSSREEKAIYDRQVDKDGVSHVETAERLTGEDGQRLRYYFEDFGNSISEAYRKKSILSDLAERGGERKGVFSEIKSIYDWFEQMIILFPYTSFRALNDLPTNDNRKADFSRMLSLFDTGIESVEGEQRIVDFDKLFVGYPDNEIKRVKTNIENHTEKKMVRVQINGQLLSFRRDKKGDIVYNKILFDHGNSKDRFEYRDESDGTKRLFDLIPLLMKKTQYNVLLIDEIDRSLHTKLVKKLIEVFFTAMKKSKKQLIATTHNVNLLDLGLLRQDEIWFVDRKEDHSSQIYSLNKFRERFDKKIDKEYLLGRYGAIPVFSGEWGEADGESV